MPCSSSSPQVGIRNPQRLRQWPVLNQRVAYFASTPILFVRDRTDLCAAGLYDPAIMDDDSAKYRKQADECREQAGKAYSPLDKEAWLRVAGEWLKLAVSSDARRNG
jgi:hypothetical protein